MIRYVESMLSLYLGIQTPPDDCSLTCRAGEVTDIMLMDDQVRSGHASGRTNLEVYF